MGVLMEHTAVASEAAEGAVEDLDGALAACDAILDIHPRNVDALAGRGGALRALGRPMEALEALLDALSIDPGHARARLELALALRDSGRHEEARTLYGLLLRDSAAPAEAWHDLALFLLTEGHRAAAETCLRRAVAMAPDRVGARQSLADLLALRGHPAAAADLYHEVLAIAPDSAPAHAGLGQTLIALGRLDEAEARLERALVMDGGNALAHMGRARLNLLKGNLPAAWEDLDWRWPLAGRTRPEPPGMAWDGNTDLTGETILLWAEQGLGETIALLRFVPLVTGRGARVVLGLPAPLLPLMAGMAGIAGAVASGRPVPPELTPDFNASLPDLPRLLGMTIDTLPPAAVLTVPPGHRPRVQAPATALLKVGLAWAGPRAAWNVPVAQLMPLLALPQVAVFSLQLGNRARDMAELAHPALITDLAPTISDYADLAGRMAEMDVVITVDGPIAQLAGALGVPAWVLLPMAPDWRWAPEGGTTPWMPSARLFRQTRSDDWNAPVQQLCRALREEIAVRRIDRDQQAEALSGERAAERAFLAAHLQPGDLLVDAGSGDGTLAVEAAENAVTVLAVEARADLAKAIPPRAGLEVVTAALAGTDAPAVVAARPKRGRVVFPLPTWVHGRTRTTTLDVLLAGRPDLTGRRLVLRLGARDAGRAILAGLSTAPAVVLFHHHPGGTVAGELQRRGYGLHRFPGAVAAGPLAPFNGESGPVLALAANESPAALYGDASDPTSPAAMAHAAAKAAAPSADGARALMAGQLNQAGALLARALALDPGNAAANANLGGLLRRIGRADAAAACWRRALESGAGPAVGANLANVLRELGKLDAAADEFARVLAAEPDNPRFLYAFGLLERDRGRSPAALALFDRAEQLAPGAVPRGELAATLLKSGNLARGMAEMAFRQPSRLPAIGLPAWDGGRLVARAILVRDEGDVIDTILLARFIPQVARQGGLVVVECVPEAARLLAGVAGVEQVVARGGQLPPLSCKVRLLDVPRLIGTTSRTTPLRDVPYLHLPEGVAPHVFPNDRRLRVGIAWNRHDNRTAPLEALLRLAAIPGIVLVSLQRDGAAEDLERLGALPFVEEMGSHAADLASSAALIAGLDVVIAADTVEAHVAGALGKPVWVLLPKVSDWRWVDGRDDSVWYPTMRVFRQDADGSWDAALSRVSEAASAMAAGKMRG